jgi:hypothetical protein
LVECEHKKNEDERKTMIRREGDAMNFKKKYFEGRERRRRRSVGTSNGVKFNGSD